MNARRAATEEYNSQRDLVFSPASPLLQSPVGQGRGSSVIFLAHRVLHTAAATLRFLPLNRSSIPRLPRFVHSSPVTEENSINSQQTCLVFQFSTRDLSNFF